jgi:hypothetical protein
MGWPGQKGQASPAALSQTVEPDLATQALTPLY